MPSGAERFPTFNPALATIAGITPIGQAIPPLANQSGITTSFAHTFHIGEYVKFIVPDEYGMTQMNNKTGLITIADPAFPTLFIVDIDSSMFDAFVVPAVPTQSAQAIPAGEVATTLLGANKNVLPYP